MRKIQDVEKMNNPAAAFYVLAALELVDAAIAGFYSNEVPKEVQSRLHWLVEYFRFQLPPEGFDVKPSEYGWEN